MKCEWLPDGPEKNGKRAYKCARYGCGLKTKLQPHPPEKIHSVCRAWPRWHEFGHWVALVLEAVGLSENRWNWLRWRLGFITPCGCKKRKERLNWVGRTIKGWLQRLPKIQR